MLWVRITQVMKSTPGIACYPLLSVAGIDVTEYII